MGIVVHKIRVKKVKKTGGGEAATLPLRLNRDDAGYLRELTHGILFGGGGGGGEDRAGGKQELPPLTTSNELDVKLYALFALLLKSFVFGWYSESLQLGGREEFTRELVYLFAHVCRAVQERAIAAQDELVATLVVDVPILVRRHLERIAEVRLDPAVEKDEVETVWLKRYGNGLDDAETMARYRRVLVHGIVGELFPQEVLKSRVSREFVVSLLDGVALRGVTESMCDNFALWELIGRAAEAFGPSRGIGASKEEEEEEGEEGNNTKGDSVLSRLHRLLEFFVIDPRYEVRQVDKQFSYGHLMPLLALIEYMTCILERFPLSMALAHVIVSVMMGIGVVRWFVHACLKRAVYENVLTARNVGFAADSLRHMLFPRDETFAPEPRYVPEMLEELEAVRVRNEGKVRLLFCNGGFLQRVLFNETNDEVEEKVALVMDVVEYRGINAVFIQELIDLLICRLFPELEGMKVMVNT